MLYSLRIYIILIRDEVITMDREPELIPEEVEPIIISKEEPQTILESRETLHISISNSFDITLSSSVLTMDDLINRALFLKEHFFNGQSKSEPRGVG